MYLSNEGIRLSHKSGLRTIMDDIATTLARGGSADSYINLSIGNPAAIPQVEARWNAILRRVGQSDIPASVNSYGPSRGEEGLIREIIRYFGLNYGWALQPENIVVGPGSQFLCYAAGVLFSGPDGNSGAQRPVVLPRLPDYTGYEGLGVPQRGLIGLAPRILKTGGRTFRYEMRRDALAKIADAGLLVASTPSNPTSQELNDSDICAILDVATRLDSSVVLDHAYGQPFPRVAPSSNAPPLHPHVINCFSLSKAGLPGARIAFAIGAPERINAMAAFVSNSVLHASRTSQNIAAMALKDGLLDDISATCIAPHYKSAAAQALSTLQCCLPRELNWKVHSTEGGMFLWLWIDEPWFDDLEFYQRAKSQGVFVTPGRSFFLSPDEPAPWMRQCLRLSLNQSPALLEEGLQRLAGCLEVQPAHCG